MQILENDLVVFEVCKSCGGKSIEPIIIVRTSTGLTFFERSFCKACGLLFASITPSLDWFLRFYHQRTSAAIGSGKPNIKPHIEQLRVIRYQSYLRILAPLLPATKEQPSILDIGCNTGGGLNEFARAGWRVSGIELDPERADYCETNFGITVIRTPVEELSNHVGTFDVVLVAHVLEHIHDVRAFLQAVKKLVSPDGILYVEVPDLCAVDWFEALYMAHQQTFTFDSLIRLLNDHELQVAQGYRPKTKPHGAHHIAIAAQKATRPISLKAYPVPEYETVLWLCQKGLPCSGENAPGVVAGSRALEYVMDDVGITGVSDIARLQPQVDGSILVLPTTTRLPRRDGRQHLQLLRRVLCRIRNLSEFAASLRRRLFSYQGRRQSFDVGAHLASEVEQVLPFPTYALFPKD